MQNVKSGKEEIIYLLTKAIGKYKLETGQEIIQNTNRKNYESLAILLSEISNQLPSASERFGTDSYNPDNNPQAREYPHRKYDITGGQIKDALIGMVSNPRPFLVDACYIYLYGIGRKAFKLNPVDENLLESPVQDKKDADILTEKKHTGSEEQISLLEARLGKTKKTIRLIAVLMAAFCLAAIALYTNNRVEQKKWAAIKKDMNLLPYQPTQAEIDSLEGVWLCYTGSPQARISDQARYHKVVSNFIEIKYKDGYFTYNRYGASFNHIGYLQFESPGIVSVYSRIRNSTGNTESPRHSLLNLHTNRKYLSAISASWNFDIGDKNKIIGIREIYIKLGKGGAIEEVINEIENASCQCKIIRWHQLNNKVQTYYLKNQLLDSLQLNDIKSLIDENSIIPGIPQDSLVLFKTQILQ